MKKSEMLPVTFKGTLGWRAGGNVNCRCVNVGNASPRGKKKRNTKQNKRPVAKVPLCQFNSPQIFSQ